jgi:NitT/TauT family transport system ATP-binding protein
MITIKHISHSYQNNQSQRLKEVLVDITMTINKGEFVSILGPSGCGKTTLVNILAGYCTPQKGEILINNSIVTKPGKNRIVVNQENDLFEWMTVKENMKIIQQNEKTIETYLSLVGLITNANDYPNSLSGGMKKRLSLARALAAEPSFLILDEPFSSLDHYSKEVLHQELEKLFIYSKKTILLVTHDIDEAIFLSDRIFVFSGDPSRKVVRISINKKHPRTKQFKHSQKFKEIEIHIKKVMINA